MFEVFFYAREEYYHGFVLLKSWVILSNSYLLWKVLHIEIV